jgi:hypothetical protein
MPGWPHWRFAHRAREHTEVVRIDRTPDLQDVSPSGRPLEWGPPLSDNHDLITRMTNGDPLPEDFDQQGLGSCALDADARGMARLWLLAKAGVVRLPGLWTPDRAFRRGRDGTWELRWPETCLQAGSGQPDDPYGAAVPTGRLLGFTWDATRVPVYRNPADPGRPAFVDLRLCDVLWPQAVLESAARFDQAWTQERAAIHASEYPQLADVRGYPRLDNGSCRPEQVEFLSQMSGLPAVTVTGRTAAEAAAGWQALTGQGRPVTTGSKQGVQGNPYDVISFPEYGHGYGVLKVCHGTQAQALAESGRLHALIRETTGLTDPPPHVPAPGARNPQDPRWPAPDPEQRQYWVIFDNPWGYYQPKPVPLAHVDSLFWLDAATIGTVEEIRDLPRALPRTVQGCAI